MYAVAFIAVVLLVVLIDFLLLSINAIESEDAFTVENTLILYGSLTGTSEKLGRICEKIFLDQSRSVVVQKGFDIQKEDVISYFKTYTSLILILPTYIDGLTSPDINDLLNELIDLSNDHRVTANTLIDLKVAVFGLGEMSYGSREFNKAAKSATRALKSLGARFLVKPVYHDVQLDEGSNIIVDMVKRFIQKQSEVEDVISMSRMFYSVY
ncbi:hypothetical protein ACOME3_002045 [Neoechinorhynchus agilis]